MGLVADEYSAADNYWFFKEPLYVRNPINTEEVFTQFLNDPTQFVDLEIPKEYLGQRYHDLGNDQNDLMGKGTTTQLYYQIRYYTGMVSKLRELFFSAEPYGLIAIGYDYINEQSKLDRMKGKFPIPVYFYHKGIADILKQIVLNIPLVKKE
jgi:hypothetical protein